MPVFKCASYKVIKWPIWIPGDWNSKVPWELNIHDQDTYIINYEQNDYFQLHGTFIILSVQTKLWLCCTSEYEVASLYTEGQSTTSLIIPGV